MNAQINLQNILNKKFMEMKARNPSFSLRAYAKRLEVQSSPLSEILKGKRRVSRSMAEKFATKLMLDPTETMYLLKDFPAVQKRNSYAKEKKSQDMEMTRLNAEQFNLISDWVHYAILNLITTKDFISDPKWIAERLAVKKEKVDECLTRLFKLELIKRNDEGHFVRTKSNLNTSDDVVSLSVKKAHLIDMDMAKEKLLQCDVSQRDFTSITIPFDQSLMPEVKQMIRKLQSEIYELMQEHGPQEVYKINTYLYPLTKTDLQENKHEKLLGH